MGIIMSLSPRQAATSIVIRLRQAGHEALFAGGCVRDLLLGKEPADYDVATSASPDQVMQLFDRTVAVGVQFGVVVVLLEGTECQVATFRCETGYQDGRHPDAVTFTDAAGDAARRDFTINGLFMDPESGEIVDHVGGRADLERCLLRCIGRAEERFHEDKLRLLRAVRFAASLGFEVEAETWQAVKTLAPEIRVVSPERIRDELVKMFLSPSRVMGLDLLEASGLLDVLLPEVAALKGCTQPPDFHPEGDVYVHTRLMLALLPDRVSLPLVLSVLFHDLGKVPTRVVDETGRIRFNGHERESEVMTIAIMDRLRFSNAEIESTAEMVKCHMAFKDVRQMRVAKLKRFMARPTFTDELELHRVDCMGSHGLLDNLTFLRQKAEEFANEPLIPPPLVTGRDLIQLGMKPGPAFKPLLEAIQTAQLEGEVSDRESALALATLLVAERGAVS